MYKQFFLIPVIILILLSLSACKTEGEVEISQEEVKFLVSGQYLSDFENFKQELSYAGIIFPLAEANILAKASGTLIENDLNLGDFVEVGQNLARIDDLTSGFNQNSVFNINQIKQAEIAVNQAKNAYDLALVNYNNILSASIKDKEQAELNFQQSLKNKNNLNLTVSETIVSAEIAYETAKLAVNQAELSLNNAISQFKQTKNDLDENSKLLANSTINIVNSLLTNINNITAFDSNNLVSIDYKNNLGALDSSALIRARNLYNQTKNDLERVNKLDLELKDYIDEVISLIELTKDLTDSVKLLFNKTITSSNLNQAQLASLQNQASSFQVQASTALSQIKGVKQALNNFDLESKNSLKLLEKSYDLALKQVASAKQNLNNLEAGNISQLDQASFAIQLAENQLKNLEIKLESQIESAKSQVNSARLQYENSLLSLDSLYDSYTLISPLSGSLSSKNFSSGDTVNAGQLVYTISQTDKLKVVFFVEEDKINLLKLGQEIKVNQKSIANISSLSLQADPITKKFKVEAILNESKEFTLRSVVDVLIEIERPSLIDNHYFLPLSSINISQTGNLVFLYDEGRAKEMSVDIIEVIGERAKVKIEDKDNYIIITNGNRRLQAGQLIEVDI